MPTHVLGVSAYFHDSAAALVTDGRIVAAAQEERFTRRKGEARFPSSAVASCVRQAGIDLSDVDHVVFHEKPLLKLERLLSTYNRAGPAGWPSAREALPLWARHRIDIAGDIRRRLGRAFAGIVSFAEHHESHAASAFFPSPFERAAILVMDAVGEWTTSSIGIGRGSRLELLREQRFPHSLGMLYSAFTHYLGFAVNSGEYKVMGLAPYGEPRFAQDLLDELVHVHDDGSLELDRSYFAYEHGAGMTTDRFGTLFGGPPREPGGPITQRHMDLAASIQTVCEEVVLRVARHVHHLTGERRLVMAGGVALNCVANGRVVRDGPFDEVWVQPAAGDAGGSLGAALLLWHHALGEPRHVQLPDAQSGSLLGPSFSDADVGLFLDGAGARSERVDDEDELLDRVAAWLEEGRTVGWFHGRMEFGPRALGARSILADARSLDMQARVNRAVKLREEFRPFAPSVLRQFVGDLFDVAGGHDSPYMLFVAALRERHRRALTPDEKELLRHPDIRVRASVPRSSLPAVTHVDHSARIQTVDPQRHGRYYRLLRRFHERTGCPVVLNTSFNVRGEPIVHSPLDAYRCFLATGLDCLVLENHLLVKSDQPAVPHQLAVSSSGQP